MTGVARRSRAVPAAVPAAAPAVGGAVVAGTVVGALLDGTAAEVGSPAGTTLPSAPAADEPAHPDEGQCPHQQPGDQRAEGRAVQGG